jgi:hypothetical protein
MRASGWPPRPLSRRWRSPIDPAASGTELRAKFAAFLETEAVRTLIGSLTHVGPGMSWKNLAGNGPRTLEAALTAGDDALEQ